MSGTEKRPVVSVIIPHFNDLVGLDLCLDALAIQQVEVVTEVIVADNNSIAGIEEVRKVVAGRARLISVMEKGAGPARNGGVSIATGEVLAFIDSDCIAAPDWIAQGLKMLGKFDVIGGHVTVITRDRAITGVEGFELLFAFNFANYISAKGFCGAGNMFVRRSVFDVVGGFSKNVSEDVEWCHRATSRGYTLGYGELATVGHPARRTWKDLISKWKRLQTEMYLLGKKKKVGRTRWLVKTWLMPLSAIYHTPKVLRSRRLANWSERFSALKILYLIRLWRFVDGNRLFFRGERREPDMLATVAWYLRNQ